MVAGLNYLNGRMIHLSLENFHWNQSRYLSIVSVELCQMGSVSNCWYKP